MSENIQGEDYEVIIRSKTSDGTEVVTSAEAITDKWLANAVAGYDATNQKYSAYLKDGNSSSDKLTPEYIDELADGTQSDLKKIQVINGFHVEKVRRNQAKNKICVMQKENVLEFDSLVLACGGKAAPKTGSDGSGYELAKSIGHSLVPVVPALVQLKCKEEWFKSISGVRAKAGICVRGNDEKEYEENGEIQFTDYGISGIPVFQLSRVANYILRERKEIEFIIDFLPWMNKEGFAERLLAERSSIEDGRTLEEYFTGILNKKIMLLFLKICGLHPGDLVKSVKRDKLKKVYELCRDFKVTVVGSNSFDNAQVCAGGVPLHEVSEGMESGKMPGFRG